MEAVAHDHWEKVTDVKCRLDNYIWILGEYAVLVTVVTVAAGIIVVEGRFWLLLVDARSWVVPMVLAHAFTTAPAMLCLGIGYAAQLARGVARARFSPSGETPRRLACANWPLWALELLAQAVATAMASSWGIWEIQGPPKYRNWIWLFYPWLIMGWAFTVLWSVRLYVWFEHLVPIVEKAPRCRARIERRVAWSSDLAMSVFAGSMVVFFAIALFEPFHPGPSDALTHDLIPAHFASIPFLAAPAVLLVGRRMAFAWWRRRRSRS